MTRNIGQEASLKVLYTNRRNLFLVLIVILVLSLVYFAESNRQLEISCEDVTWSDVVLLVQPHIDEMLHTNLVMQGQSSEYHPSEAARQVMSQSLPEDVQRTLRAIIKAGC